MKGKSKDYCCFRDLVVGVNQNSVNLNPPWQQSVEAEPVVPL
jgi:hypothetical protein